MNEGRYVTVTVKTNMTPDIYFNENSAMSFEPTDQGALSQKLLDALKPGGIEDYVRKIINNFDDYKDIDTSLLEIDIVIEEAYMTKFTREVKYAGYCNYGLPYSKTNAIQEKELELSTIQEKMSEIDNEICDLKSDYEDLEEKETELQKDLKELKKAKIL